MNGLWGAVLYTATLFALYGMKDAGSKDAKEIEQIENLVARKSLAGQKAGATRKQALAEIRARRYEARTRGTALAEDVAFREANVKQEFLR